MFRLWSHFDFNHTFAVTQACVKDKLSNNALKSHYHLNVVKPLVIVNHGAFPNAVVALRRLVVNLT